MCDTSTAAVDNFTEQIFLLAWWRTPIGWRGKNLSTQLGSGVPRPAWVIKHSTCQRDDIGFTPADDVFGLLRLGDQADGNGGEAGGRSDRIGKRHLVARRSGYFLQRRNTARGDGDPVGAALFELGGISHGLFQIPATLDPIGGGQSHANRFVCWKRGPHDFKNFERIAHAVRERAAIFIRASIADG